MIFRKKRTECELLQVLKKKHNVRLRDFGEGPGEKGMEGGVWDTGIREFGSWEGRRMNKSSGRWEEGGR